jgi:S-DNA-T family DNA segregation ATPase FtsK/SpoIIIE
MLFMTPGAHKFIRAQGSYVSDLDTQNVLEFVTEEAEPTFHRELVQLKVEDSDGGEAGEGVMARGCDDDMYLPAIEVVLEHQRGSVSLLQRRLGIGYGRAARLIDQMAEDGIVGTYAGSQAREVLITLEQWEAMRQQQEGQDPATDETDTELTPEEAEMET